MSLADHILAAVTKLHGRKVFTLALKFGECFLDLSFMPTTPNAKVQARTEAHESGPE